MYGREAGGGEDAFGKPAATPPVSTKYRISAAGSVCTMRRRSGPCTPPGGSKLGGWRTCGRREGHAVTPPAARGGVRAVREDLLQRERPLRARGNRVHADPAQERDVREAEARRGPRPAAGHPELPGVRDAACPISTG